jgi:hypothetical protein
MSITLQTNSFVQISRPKPQIHSRLTLSFLIVRSKVGFLFTYVAPLIFVLSITVVKEGYDDFQRYKRDAAGATLRVVGFVLGRFHFACLQPTAKCTA